jgi:3-oxoacyl-[acyl-carrier-protein] synthase-3
MYSIFDILIECDMVLPELQKSNEGSPSLYIRQGPLPDEQSIDWYHDWKDRNTCVLFGDGAGAVILKASDEPGILATHLGADGQYRDLLYYPVGASKDLHKAGTDEAAIQMTGNEVFKVAVKTLGNVAVEVLKKAGVSQDDLDWLVPHQANIRIIQATAKRLDLPMEKVILTVQDHGNTSAASVPMALDVGIRDGRIKKGQLVLMEAFGGGFTWGSVLIRL